MGRPGRAEDKQLPGVPRVRPRRRADAARGHRLGGGVPQGHLAARSATRAHNQRGQAKPAQPAAVRPDRPALAARHGQAVVTATAHLRVGGRHRGQRRHGADPLQHLPVRGGPRGGHPRRVGPGGAGTLPGVAGHRRARSRRQGRRRHRCRHVLPGRPPTRLGPQPADHRGVLHRGPATPSHQGQPTPGRARHDAGRGRREPGPVAHPRGTAGHRHPDPVRPARHRRPAP